MNKEELCFVCNANISTAGHYAFSWHLRNVHGIDRKLQYLEQYVWTKEYMKCTCGCGLEVGPLKFYPYKRMYKSGHNSVGGTNPNYGKHWSADMKQQMQESAYKRMEVQKAENNGILPMHSEAGIQKRAAKWTAKFIEGMERTHNVKILDWERGTDENYHKLWYKVQCQKCNSVFEQGHQGYFRCYLCCPRVRSQYEEEIVIALAERFPELVIDRNNRTVLAGNREIDIYMPDFNLGIEFNGLYWHSELAGGKTANVHLQKTEECKGKGIQLIHIFEDEWIFNKDVVIDKLMHKLNKFSGDRIFARKCDIREINFPDTSEFLDSYHLQGADSSKFRYGLYYNDKLISVMTFSKPNASRGRSAKNAIENEYEISRYATKTNTLVVGGASRLFKHFITTLSPSIVYSYADLRWVDPDNNVYSSIGFTYTSTSKPNYWYFFKNEIKRWHRFNFTKKKTIEMGGDPNLTEWQNMQNFGYDRIWDCGNLKYTWKPA